MPAIVKVHVEINRRREENKEDITRKGKNRMRRNTPAVTRVEEWTRAETGVGAAIAAGSQLENGSWALFVMAARRIRIVKIWWWGEWERLIISQSPWFSMKAIVIRIIASPIRLERAVNIPPAKDFGFW